MGERPAEVGSKPVSDTGKSQVQILLAAYLNLNSVLMNKINRVLIVEMSENESSQIADILLSKSVEYDIVSPYKIKEYLITTQQL